MQYRALIKAYNGICEVTKFKIWTCGSIKVFINYVKKIKFLIPTKLSVWVIPTLFTHLFSGQSAGRGTTFTGWRQSWCTVGLLTQATSSRTDGARCSPTRDTGLTGTLLDSLPSCSSVSVSFVSSPLSNHNNSLQILCTVIQNCLYIPLKNFSIGCFFTKNINAVVKNIIIILIILDFQDCSVWLLV